MAKEKKYESKAIPSFIEAHSRISVKIKNNFYTFEFAERRELPIDTMDSNKVKVNFNKERELLWRDIHAEVDKQVQDIVDIMKP